MSESVATAPPMARYAPSGLRRWLPIFICLILEIALIRYAADVRALEARMAEPLIGLVTGGSETKSVGDIVFFALGDSGAQGLRISPGCSVTALLIPFFAAFALFGVLAARSLHHWCLAALVGTSALILINLLRVGIIAFAVHTWGPGAFTVSHWYIGSLFAIIGFTVAMIASVRLLTRERKGAYLSDDAERPTA
ncbi:exosortase/archaeosortase family protein [Cumulibacter soli]|uniref:exosortase/archaeosortase family protein n=1 Tax=Cumulibacter soli TaxID=2546344 RepID=UPI001067E478|nr:exosortase/archaeosortase family protein [Cumulibacter soli]